MSGGSVRVEVAYAEPDRQFLQSLTVPAGTTALEAVELSDLHQQFPALDMTTLELGVFGRLLPEPWAHVLEAGERVEVYRPLVRDPREARRRRARSA